MRNVLLCVFIMEMVASGQGISRRVFIENQAGMEVTGVFASSRNSRQWGPNRLHTSLQSGYQIEIDLSDGSGSCNLDVLVTLVGRRQMRGAYDVCSTSRIVVNASNADNLPVTFINRTPDLIRYLYVGGDGWWTGDLLGPGISLATDSSHDRIVRSPKGCLFNIRAVYWDESDLVMESVDLCSSQRVEISRPKR